MRSLLCQTIAISLIAFSITSSKLCAAEDASIDRLLSKLPPPEKLVKPRVQHAVKQSDNALNDPLAKKALTAYFSGSGSDALKYSRQLAQKNSHSAIAHFLHGVCAFYLNQLPEATGAFRSSVVADSGHAISHLLLGASEMLQKHYASAIPPLEKTGELAPSWGAGWLLASQCAIELGRREESLTFAKRATAAEPDWAFTWLQLARAQRANGHPEETLNALSKGAEVAPDSGDMFAAIGFSYINLNRIQEAIRPLEHAARLLPRDYLVHAQLGFCLQATGQVDAGIAQLRKGASLKSDYGPVWEHLGLAYQRKGDHRNAITSFEKAANLMPRSAHPWEHLSIEYRAVGRTADAQRAETRAKQIGQGATKKKS
jgi:tetratricopeptide (TPR) repeat protein